MRTSLYFNSPRDVDMLRPVVHWLDNYLIFTDNPVCAGLCKKYKLKYRYVKDYRILVWEMAKWQPSVFLDFALCPHLFPRNGSINMYVPSKFHIYLNDSLLFYDYLLVSNRFNKIDMENFGIQKGKIKIVGYPRFDLAVRGEAVLLQKSEQKVFDKYKETKLKGSDAGLKIASFAKMMGERNNYIYSYPNLSVPHPSFIQKKEPKHVDKKEAV